MEPEIELTETEKETVWTPENNFYERRIGTLYISNEFFKDAKDLSNLPKLPPDASIKRIFYCFDRDAIGITFHHQELDSVNEGSLIPIYAPFCITHQDGTYMCFWPDDWKTSCKVRN